MDVTCERCGTEYELDDALVSERGTAVKCTSCDHQFKVFRPATGDAVQERWIVRLASGRELVFLTLRELQRAIEQGRIGREDLLSRGTDPPRPLGSIAELDSFFHAAEARAQLPATPQELPEAVGKPQPPPQPTTQPPPPTPPAPPRAAQPIRPAPPPPRGPVVMDPTPSDWLGIYGPDSAEAYVPVPPRRKRGLRLFVGLVVLGATAFVAVTYGRPYLEQLRTETQKAPAADARFEELLAQGEGALEQGDWEGAKEAFDKASVLSGDNPRLLAGLARLALFRADLEWLKLRLSENEAPSVREAIERAQKEAALRAREAVQRLSRVQPSSEATLRARIDAARLQGDVPGARALVAQAAHLVAQPETAYTLAMLDLAEETPSLPTVLDRLRTATSLEPARARAVLVYVLVRADNLAAAKSELERLLAMPHPHPLAPELQSFVTRAEGDPKAKAPNRKTDEPREPGPTRASKVETPREAAIPTDHHELLKQAARAKAQGDLDRADLLYRAALERNPGDSEALGGLGDIARARGQAATALSYYERAYQQNPNYLPVMSALAEMRLQSGDVQGARTLFRRILETAPGTALAARAEERLRQLDAPSSTQPSPATPSEPSPPSPEKAEPQPAPEIDTSDLPDFQR